MKKNGRLAAVVVTFNRIEFLKKTVQVTLNSDLDSLVIVNNASTDGTKEWLGTLSDTRLHVINLDKNVGGAGGFNIGFDYVVNVIDMDWLVCYDDDAYPEANAISIFQSLELSDKIAGVASAVYLPDGRICEMNRPSRNPFATLSSIIKTILKFRSGFHVSDDEYDKTDLVNIDYSSFVGCFLRIDAIRKYLGLPREDLFIYADDIIYTYGIGSSGLTHVFAPSIKFIHDCSTLTKNNKIYEPVWKVYYTYRNGLELYRKLAGNWFFYPIAFLKLFLWAYRGCYYNNRPIYFRLLWRAWCDGMKRNFHVSHNEILEIATNARSNY